MCNHDACLQTRDDKPDLHLESECDALSNSVNVNGTSSPEEPQLSSINDQTPTKSDDSVTNASNESNKPKRLYISNIPFRFRDPDLRAMCNVSTSYSYSFAVWRYVKCMC